MAVISQRYALAVPDPKTWKQSTTFVHSPLDRLRACRAEALHCPASEPAESAEDLVNSMRWMERQGLAILDHTKPLQSTGYEISEESFDWLDLVEPPSDFSRWYAEVVTQTWSGACRPHLLVVHDSEGLFVYCDPIADLSDVPADLRDVIEWAMAEKIKWIGVIDPFVILAELPSC